MSTILPNRAVTAVRQSPNYSAGRPAGAPNTITIHWWGSYGQTHDGVVNYLCRKNGDTSAHYVASSQGVTQIISDRDRAWHAGALGNPRSIGIECRPEMTDQDFAVVAKLVAAIREEHGDLPLKGHKDWMATQCPGTWYANLARLDQMARGQKVAAASAGTTALQAQTAAATTSAELTATDKQLMLDVDGIPGGHTYARFNQVMGTGTRGYASTDMWAAFQKFLGTKVSANDIKNLTGRSILDADGIAGWRTWKVFQYWSAHKAPQWMKQVGGPADLNGANFGKWVDGIDGKMTWKMLQHMLNSSYANSGKLMEK
ncbi:N-acetylmuramoyl-L-alanine amidase [Actinomyces ruminis]|uniref:N-acetylmuramoyl-L-alanine amidase n=1 Tax=Actinomyces ruminis TaxID=1937003 RepID=A0ABX4MAV1_9ACTO|nr:peptidoglycan recognition family protein [Actinomyces ruminis]PHP52602.1 N-acetylmuramoyl-L-alanine amidase [Actinomyces ruminis]